jgi:uncharacterized protein YecE (DUF72 family)
MIRVGTSGFSYPEWRGRFYPRRFPSARMLPYYAERFSTVELNTTFRRMPTAEAVAGWARETPARFVFALKVPQRITHFARLRNVAKPFAQFLDTLSGLGDKCGPLLLQLPPNFRKDAGRLRRLLARVPPPVRMAVEFRHPSWLDDEVYDLLRARNAALCVADTEEATTPVIPTADFGYLRLRDRAYTRAQLARWAALAARAEWRDAFVYFKHEESGTGPRLARKLIDLLEPAAGPASRPPGSPRARPGAPPPARRTGAGRQARAHRRGSTSRASGAPRRSPTGSAPPARRRSVCP